MPVHTRQTTRSLSGNSLQSPSLSAMGLQKFKNMLKKLYDYALRDFLGPHNNAWGCYVTFYFNKQNIRYAIWVTVVCLCSSILTSIVEFWASTSVRITWNISGRGLQRRS